MAVARGRDHGFTLSETTIGQIQRAYRARELSARELVRLYIDRIAAYDQAGPTLNAIILVDPRSETEADHLDRVMGSAGPVGPLHGVPIILKDQIDVAGTATTLGSALFRDFRPARDAFIVERLRRAGAIPFAKATLAEMASGDTHGSLFGSTRNPYALHRTPGGSSGGTAAAIAANFGAVGIGMESYASLRRPAAWCALTALRPSLGLISRSGTYGGYPSRQGALGPITRSVADLAVLLDSLVGYDSEDPHTAYGYGRTPPTFAAFLDERALDGARLGIVREPMGLASDPLSKDFIEVDHAFDRAVAELRNASAILTDPLVIPRLGELLSLRHSELTEAESEESWRRYFHRSAEPPYASAAALRGSPDYEKVVTRGGVWAPGSTREAYLAARRELMTIVLNVMAAHRLDALVYKTVEHGPQLLSAGSTERSSYIDGRGSTHLNTFLIDVPALTVSAPNTAEGIPTGITFQGRPYEDGRLIALAYAYERATRHRSAPESTPPLENEPP